MRRGCNRHRLTFRLSLIICALACAAWVRSLLAHDRYRWVVVKRAGPDWVGHSRSVQLTAEALVVEWSSYRWPPASPDTDWSRRESGFVFGSRPEKYGTRLRPRIEPMSAIKNDPRFTGYLVQFPLWVVVVLSSAPLLEARFMRWWKNRRLAKGLCRQCGYDLRGSPARCPECGEVAGTPEGHTP